MIQKICERCHDTFGIRETSHEHIDDVNSILCLRCRTEWFEWYDANYFQYESNNQASYMFTEWLKKTRILLDRMC